MQCEAFEDRLNDLLDSREPVENDAVLAGHAADCPHCSATLRGHAQWISAFPLPGLTQARHEQNHHSLRSFTIAVGVVAASLALWISLPFALAPQSESDFVADVSDQLLVMGADESPRQAAFVHQPLLSIGLLAQADWSQTQVALPFEVPVANIDPTWFNAVSDGMTPVQQSMTKAFEVLRSSLSLGATS